MHLAFFIATISDNRARNGLNGNFGQKFGNRNMTFLKFNFRFVRIKDSSVVFALKIGDIAKNGLFDVHLDKFLLKCG